VPSFPREEDLHALVGDRDYVQGARWSVFEDLEVHRPGRDVLLVLGDNWTVFSGEEFKALAQRILPQL